MDDKSADKCSISFIVEDLGLPSPKKVDPTQDVVLTISQPTRPHCYLHSSFPEKDCLSSSISCLPNAIPADTPTTSKAIASTVPALSNNRQPPSKAQQTGQDTDQKEELDLKQQLLDDFKLPPVFVQKDRTATDDRRVSRPQVQSLSGTGSNKSKWWQKSEDSTLLSLLADTNICPDACRLPYGIWSKISRYMKHRTPRACRLRYTNHLDFPRKKVSRKEVSRKEVSRKEVSRKTIPGSQSNSSECAISEGGSWVSAGEETEINYEKISHPYPTACLDSLLSERLKDKHKNTWQSAQSIKESTQDSEIAKDAKNDKEINESRNQEGYSNFSKRYTESIQQFNSRRITSRLEQAESGATWSSY